ncbi:MAG: hypothetical protein LBG81_07770, partial [Coriobacteriaceae bacterium]|nr:hypothetical protein [Coriobacteriaceae bacterium]
MSVASKKRASACSLTGHESLAALAVAAMLLFTLFAAVACAPQPNPSFTRQAPAPEAPAPVPEEEALVIGKESDTALKMPIENASGKTITALSVKPSTEPEYPASIMKSGQKLEKDGKALL